MKLSLVKILNEIKIEEVAQRAMSKGFLKAVVNYFEDSRDFRDPQVLNDAQAVMREFTASVQRADIPEQFKGLALQWLVSLFISKNIVPETAHVVARLIEKYFQVQRYASEKNLMNIRSIEQLDLITNEAFKIYQDRTSNDKVSQLKKQAEYEKVLETPKYEVFIPHNKAAACFLGLQTKWCTAATQGENYYEHYHKPNDPLFIFFDRQTKEKFQVNFGSDQFMDAQDHDVALNKKIEFIKTLQPLVDQYESVPEIQKNPERHSPYPTIIRGWDGIKYLDEKGNIRISQNDKQKTFYNENGKVHKEDGPAIVMSHKKVWRINGTTLGEVIASAARQSFWVIYSKKYINSDGRHGDKITIRIIKGPLGDVGAEFFMAHGGRIAEVMAFGPLQFSDQNLPQDIISIIEQISSILQKNKILRKEVSDEERDHLMFEFVKSQNDFLVKDLSDTADLSENRLKLADVLRIVS